MKDSSYYIYLQVSHSPLSIPIYNNIIFLKQLYFSAQYMSMCLNKICIAYTLAHRYSLEPGFSPVAKEPLPKNDMGFSPNFKKTFPLSCSGIFPHFVQLQTIQHSFPYIIHAKTLLLYINSILHPVFSFIIPISDPSKTLPYSNFHTSTLSNTTPSNICLKFFHL